MDVDLLNSELVKENLLKKIIYFDKLDSTNEYVKKNKTESDNLIITSSQTKGKGRFNRAWYSAPEKNLAFTITKSISLPIDEIHLVNFYSSYILYQTLKNFLSGSIDLDFLLKWPNDILLNGKKISGLLLEVNNINSEIKNFIIGIGINVNQMEFPDNLILIATSLKKETCIEINLEKLLIEFIKNFYSQYFLLNKKKILMKEWIGYTNVIGKSINFKIVNDDIPREARVLNIDFDGGLNLEFKDGSVKKFYSGEISLERM